MGRQVLSSWSPWAERHRGARAGVSLGNICSDIDMHIEEMAAGRVLGPSSNPSKEESSPMCWINLWIQTQVWCDLVGRGHNPHDPASARHLPSIASRRLGLSCPNALGPSAGLPCTAAGRLGQQPVSGAWGKPIPSLLNESLVSQSLPLGGGGRLEPHSEQCQACCQQPSAQIEAGDKEPILCLLRLSPLPLPSDLEINGCRLASSAPGYHLQSELRNGI